MAQPPGLSVGLKIPKNNIWGRTVKSIQPKNSVNAKGSPTTVQIIFESLLVVATKIANSIKDSLYKSRVEHMKTDAIEILKSKFKTIVENVQKEKDKLEDEMANDALDLDCNSLLTFLNGKYNLKSLIQAFFDKYDEENNETREPLDDIDCAKAIFDLLYNSSIKYNDDLPKFFTEEGPRKGQVLTDEERRELLCRYINRHFDNDSYNYSKNYNINPSHKALGDTVKINTKVGFHAPYFGKPWHPGQIYYPPLKKTESGYEEYPVKLFTGTVVGVTELDPNIDPFTHVTYIPIEVNVRLDDGGETYAFPSSRLYDLSHANKNQTRRIRSPKRKQDRSKSRSRSRNNSPDNNTNRSKSRSRSLSVGGGFIKHKKIKNIH